MASKCRRLEPRSFERAHLLLAGMPYCNSISVAEAIASSVRAAPLKARPTSSLPDAPSRICNTLRCSLSLAASMAPAQVKLCREPHPKFADHYYDLLQTTCLPYVSVG